MTRGEVVLAVEVDRLEMEDVGTAAIGRTAQVVGIPRRPSLAAHFLLKAEDFRLLTAPQHSHQVCTLEIKENKKRRGAYKDKGPRAEKKKNCPSRGDIPPRQDPTAESC